MRKALTIVLAMAIAVAWTVCIETYATAGGGAYNDGVFTILVGVPVVLTLVAGLTFARAWASSSISRMLIHAIVSISAVAAVLVLALAIRSRG